MLTPPAVGAGAGDRVEGEGRSLKEHLGPFIPDMKVEGNIIEAPPHSTDFGAFGSSGLKSESDLLAAFEQKTAHNWPKWLLFFPESPS